jgi:MATE family multidrug resistance protein
MRLADRHRRIWRLAGPVILSNITTPLLGAVDTGVMGHLPDPALIGGVALGSLIFNFVFWGFGFLRMGTTGLTAQAFGSDDRSELRATFLRSLMLAGGIGLALVLLQMPVRFLALHFVVSSTAVKDYAGTYFDVRIWSAPAAFANYTILGWLLGSGRTGRALALQVALNGINILLAILFVIGFGWGIPGVASATLISEALTAAFGLLMVWRLLPVADTPHLFERQRILRLLRVNGDIMLRTLCLEAAFVAFTLAGASLGDIPFAANAILMNLLTMSAYGLDGFAMAAEILVGRAMGARDRIGFRAAIRDTSLWAGGLALLVAGMFLIAGRPLIALFTVHEAVRQTAALYLPWLAASPLLGVWCFQLDGIYIGATRTAEMRNGMILSLAGTLLALWLAMPRLGNDGLWLALMVFYVLRIATLGSWLPRIDRSLAA